MHHVVLEIQEANKDVLLGKRNANCLSCGIKDGEKAANTTFTTINGKDGRIYKGSTTTTFDVSVEPTSASNNMNRVASANIRGNRFARDARGNRFASDATGFKSSFEQLTANSINVNKGKIVTPYGIQTEVRQKINSRASYSNKNATF